MVNIQERPLQITKIKNVQQKFIYELCGIYDAEVRFFEAQQMMLECAKNNQLKTMLQTHIRETEQQIKNLQQLFSAMNQQPQRVNCDAAVGLVGDGLKMLLLSAETPAIADLAIAGAQARVEHFEINCYRALVKAAEQMNQTQAVQILRQNLQQEEQTAQKIEQAMPQLLQEAQSASR